MNNIQQQSLTLQANSQLKEQQHLHSNNYQQPINSSNFLKESNTIEIEKKSLSQSFNVSSSATSTVNTISNTNTSEHSVEQPKLILNNVGNIKNNCNNENSTNYSSSSSVATNSGGNFYLLTSANQDPSTSNHLNSALTFSNQNSATIQMAVKQPIQKQFQFINTNDIQHLQTQQPSSPQFKFVTTNTTVNNNLTSVSSNFNQTSMNSSPRVIIQQQQQQQQQPVQQQTAFIVQQQQQQQIQSSNNNNSQVSQMYLNINNRIVPIQALNLKQTNSSNQNTTIGLPTTIVATQSNNNLTINGTNQTTFDIQQQQQQQQNASNQFQRLQILSTTPGSSASINFSNSNQLNTQQQQTQQLNQLKSSSIMNSSSQSYSSSGLHMPLNNNSNNNNNISSGNSNNNNINNVNTSNNNQPQYYIVSNNTSLQSISTPNGTLINNSNGISVNLQPNSPLLIQPMNNINGGGNTITMLANNTNLNTEISEKMRELEGIQSQLRTFQFKLQSSDAINNSKSPVTAVTQQQIQSVLSSVEQSQLQKLLLQRKTVQTEIHRLQQKILTPSSAENTTQVQSNDSVINNNNNTSTLTVTSTATPNTIINNNTNNTPLTKLQLYQQILIKLNNFKNSKLVINNQQQKDLSQPKTQELRMTPEEFENYKKLLTMQAQLEKELNLTKEQIQSIQQKLFQTDFTISSNLNQNQNEISINQAFDQNNGKTSSQTFSSIKLSECSLSDKNKILDVIKKQINMLKNTLNSFNSFQPSAINQQQQQQQEQIKEKYMILLKKQTELQNLIDIEERDHLITNNNGNNKNEIVPTSDTGLIQPQQYKVLNQSGQIINVTNLNFDASSNQSKQNNLVLTTGSSGIPSPNIHIVNNHSNISAMSSPNANQQTKQAPIKIRNVIASVSSTPSSNTTTPTVTNATTTLLTKTTNFTTPVRNNQTPLRALVLNNNSQHVISATNSPVIVSTSNSSSSINSNNNNNDNNNNNCNILPLSSIINLQKLHFPNVQFKCLNFDELAQHGIITKQTDESTIDMLKELDLKATQLISQDQVETFAKNQVKLARKYLEQQMSLKNSKRRKFQDQLAKDHKNVLERQNFTTLFEDRTDAIKRLAPYHIFQKTLYEPNEEENSKFDECFEEVSEKLLKTADAMKKRFHLFQLRSMQKQVSSSEETLMLKLFVDDLKQNIELEKKSQSNQPLNIKVSTHVNEANSTIRQILNISNSNDTSSVAAINTNNINNDFNLISNQNTNPLKRHIKTDENESNKQQFIYRISDQPVVKIESIKNLFQNMKTESSLVQPNSALNKTVSNSNTTSSSFFASSSSSSSSSISILNKNLNILEDQSESSDYEYLDENNKEISKSFQMSSFINLDLKKENNTSIETNLLNLNNASKEINNHLDFKNNHDTVNYQATNSLNYNHINNIINSNSNCNEDITGLDDFILNEDDGQVNQNEIDY